MWPTPGQFDSLISALQCPDRLYIFQEFLVLRDCISLPGTGLSYSNNLGICAISIAFIEEDMLGVWKNSHLPKKMSLVAVKTAKEIMELKSWLLLPRAVSLLWKGSFNVWQSYFTNIGHSLMNLVLHSLNKYKLVQTVVSTMKLWLTMYCKWLLSMFISLIISALVLPSSAVFHLP